MSLKDTLQAPLPVTAPLVLNPLMAKMAEAAGFPAGYLGGGATGYQKVALEANLNLTEMCQAAIDIRAVSSLPLILDAACGYGDPMHIHRTIGMSEAAGFAAIEIEDQLVPKRAHHHIGIEHMIPTELMAAKVREAVAARRQRDFVIIARTNAMRASTMDDALRRGEAYRKAGADVVLLSMAHTPEQLRVIAERLGGPPMYLTGRGGRRADRRRAGSHLGRRHARPAVAARQGPPGAQALSRHEGPGARRNEGSRRRSRRARPSLVGGRPQRPRPRSSTSTPGPVQGDGAARDREGREPGARRRMAEAARHARPALHLSHRAPEAVAHRRHGRLALASRRACLHPRDDLPSGLDPRGGPHCRAPSRLEARHRSPGHRHREEGRRGLCRAAGALSAGASAQRRGQGLGAALLLHGAVSLPRSAQAHPTCVTSFRPSHRTAGASTSPISRRSTRFASISART